MSPGIPMFYDLAIILSCALPVLFLSRRIGLPPVASFILTGMLIGPYGLGLIESIDHVEAAAEIGVVLLLFIVGLELSLSSLRATPWRVYSAAIGQVVLTAFLAFAAANSVGLSVAASTVAGFVVAISSSAIVLKGLADKGELQTPLGRMVVTICIVQDLAIVPMMLAVGLLSGGDLSGQIVASKSLLVFAWAASLFIFAKWILPVLMRWLVKIQVSEAIFLFSILLLLAVGALTSVAGLSVALGAFAAGIMLSENEFSAHIYSQILPFSSLFSSLFFVSIGMLLDLQFVAMNLETVLAVALGLFLLKLIVVVGVGSSLGLSWRERLQGGAYLAQIGEFSFLLISAAIAGGLLTDREFQHLIAASSLTLALTPIVMQYAPQVAYRAHRKLTGVDEDAMPEMPQAHRPKPAVLIVGFGLNGHNVARVLREAGLYYEIIEFNPQTVREARQAGELIHYGDAAQSELIKHLRVEEFDSAVIAISDPAATRRTVVAIRKLAPQTHLIVRTKYVAEVTQLERLGASLVVPEEFETSLRIFSELLAHYHLPPHIIAAQVAAVREESYGALRAAMPSISGERLARLLMQRLVEAVPISEESKARAKSLRALGFSSHDRCKIVAVLRNGAPLEGDLLDTTLEVMDLVVLYGDHAALNEGVRRVSEQV
jgi:CPA2 family monovalent cation:H+ antiporter-2